MLNNTNISIDNKGRIKRNIHRKRYTNKNLKNVHERVFKSKTAKNENRRLTNELEALLKHKLLSPYTLTSIGLKLNTFDTSNKNIEAYIKQAKKSICQHEQDIKRDKEEIRRNGPQMEEVFESIGPQPSNIPFCPRYKSNA